MSSVLFRLYRLAGIPSLPEITGTILLAQRSYWKSISAISSLFIPTFLTDSLYSDLQDL